MNAILNLDISLRLAVLSVCGALVGSLINLACYRLAWNAQSIGPWSAPPPKAGPRRWPDRIPILGWLGLRREAKWHGRGFWLRPAVVELLSAAALPALYWWCCDQRGLLFELEGTPPLGALTTLDVDLAMHWGFLAKTLLVALMAVATLIDMDEQMIPDSITVPGTLLGVLLGAACPWSLLPDAVWVDDQGRRTLAMLELASPAGWPEVLNQWPGLLLACGCVWAWCLAVAPLRWYGRHGVRRAWQLIAARAARHLYIRLGIAVTLLVAGCWLWAPRASWIGLVTALFGLAVGGGIIWLVRILGTALLKREAMGFGDVTLMAMIGTFVGWQSCPIIFFLAPFAGAVIAVIKFFIDRNREIAYGPFLCLGTLLLIVGWAPIWDVAATLYSTWWLVPGLMAVCMVLLVVLLGLLQLIRRGFSKT